MDAWFTGFAEKEGKNICFCVYLGRTDGKDVSGAAAREIAIRLITDYKKEIFYTKLHSGFPAFLIYINCVCLSTS